MLPAVTSRASTVLHTYPYWFYLPAALVFGVFFIVPTLLAFYFSLTRWSLFDATFIGFDNYVSFLGDPQLTSGLRNTIIYAVITSGLKVIISLPLAVLLFSSIKLKALVRGIIFFPVLVSTVAVGITFATLMQPSTGLINNCPGSHRAPPTRLAGQPGPRALFGGAGGYLEGCRHRDGDIPCGHRVDPAGLL